jgi:hypothetical protein
LGTRAVLSGDGCRAITTSHRPPAATAAGFSAAHRGRYGPPTARGACIWQAPDRRRPRLRPNDPAIASRRTCASDGSHLRCSVRVRLDGRLSVRCRSRALTASDCSSKSAMACVRRNGAGLPREVGAFKLPQRRDDHCQPSCSTRQPVPLQFPHRYFAVAYLMRVTRLSGSPRIAHVRAVSSRACASSVEQPLKSIVAASAPAVGAG